MPYQEIPADRLVLKDMSHLLGKYQCCTSADDGRFYADADFDRGWGVGKPRPGSISQCGHTYQPASSPTAKDPGGMAQAATERVWQHMTLWQRLRAMLRAMLR